MKLELINMRAATSPPLVPRLWVLLAGLIAAVCDTLDVEASETLPFSMQRGVSGEAGWVSC